jgi:signal transduction histidine kinase
VEFRLHLAIPNTTTIRASSEWLRRALDILIDNGVNVMADLADRVMVIETIQQKTKVKIRISDTGPGIPEDVYPHLFQDPIQKRKGSEGMGMGLLMAQAIIQTYDGEISVESTDATGTTIVVCFPFEY